MNNQIWRNIVLGKQDRWGSFKDLFTKQGPNRSKSQIENLAPSVDRSTHIMNPYKLSGESEVDNLLKKLPHFKTSLDWNHCKNKIFDSEEVVMKEV